MFHDPSSPDYLFHGIAIQDRMQKSDWIDMMALALVGRSLQSGERMLFEACLIGAIDHGTEPPSAHVTRVVASCGKPLADAVAAGLLTLGPRHGNAASAAGRWLRQQVTRRISAAQAVQEALARKERLSGFGHAVYERDPRALALQQLLQNTSMTHPHFEYALAVGEELSRQKGISLYLNIDGAMGAIAADFAWPEEVPDSLFLVARTVGLCMHAVEEAGQAKTYRRG